MNGRSYRLKDARLAQKRDGKAACKAEKKRCNDAHITQQLRPALTRPALAGLNLSGDTVSNLRGI